MSKQDFDDGGPAFPVPANEPGMSLRDYFAGQAIVPLLSTQFASQEEASRAIDKVGLGAYIIADKMLEARRRSDA